MKLLNDKQNDFSNEGLVLMAMVLEMSWAIMIVCEKMVKALSRIGINRSFFHEKKLAFTNATKDFGSFIKNMEFATEAKFDEIFSRVPNHVNERSNAIQWQANEIIQLLIIMYTRSDADFEKRDRMKKALMNFKPDPSLNIDFNSMMKFFDFKRFDE